MTTRTALIAISKENFYAREKSVKIDTVFNTFVYAPKSVLSVEAETDGGFIISVPFWVFTSKRLNPCHAVGFISNGPVR